MNTRPLLALAVVAIVPAAVIAVDSNLLGSFSVTNTFTAGTPARASEVNQNFSDVSNALLSLDDRLSQVPLSSNVVHVATSGANFTSIATAVASITDSSASNPYLVRIAPGVFDESEQTQVPAFVRLEGAGAGVTVLSINLNGNFAAGAAVTLVDHSQISNMTVHNTSTSGNAIGVAAAGVSSNAVLLDVEVRVDGNGGNAHTAVANFDGDLRIRGSRLFAFRASLLNAAFTSSDTSGAFSQPVITDSELEGDGSNNGIAVFVTNTAAQIYESRLVGGSRGVQANINGITRLFDCSVRTSNFNAVYEISGSTAVLSAGVHFIGGNAFGNPTNLKYVHCYGASFDPVADGFGSTIQ